MSGLPSRRDEAWRWSDLRGALAPQEPSMASCETAGETHVIERLASPLGAVRSLTVPEGTSTSVSDDLIGEGFAPGVLDVSVGRDATFTRIVRQSGDGIPLSLTRVRLAEGATFRQFIFAEGGRLARLECDVELLGAGARAELHGAYLVNDGAHADLTSRLAHIAPATSSSQVVRGVARKGGRGVFRGLIEVAAHAAGVDARQRHDALLLEEGGEVFAKPELQISCDDVECAHGNTIGALDGEALFYLRQRGIGLEEARAILVEAFLNEAVPDWLDDGLREWSRARVHAWLGAG